MSHQVGSALCYYVIKANGSIESWTTVQHVTLEDRSNPETAQQIDEFNNDLKGRLNDNNFHLESGENVYIEDDMID